MEIWYVTKVAVSENRFQVLRTLVEHIGRSVSKEHLAARARRSEETVRSHIKTFNKALKQFFARDRGPIVSPYGEEAWRLDGAFEFLPAGPNGSRRSAVLNSDQLFVLLQIHQYALGYSLLYKVLKAIEHFDKTDVLDVDALRDDLQESLIESRNRLSVFEAEGVERFDDYFAAVYPDEKFAQDVAEAAAIVRRKVDSPFERLAKLKQFLERSHAELTRKHMEVVARGDA